MHRKHKKEKFIIIKDLNTNKISAIHTSELNISTSKYGYSSRFNEIKKVFEYSKNSELYWYPCIGTITIPILSKKIALQKAKNNEFDQEVI